MIIEDIPGTKPTKKREYKERDPLLLDDIPGCRAVGARQARTFYKNIDYNDVTRGDWKTQRSTNPLEPRYRITDGVTDVYD